MVKYKTIAIISCLLASGTVFLNLTIKEKTINLSQSQEKSYSYQGSTIPSFFKTLIQNHLSDFAKIYDSEYKQLCSEFRIESNDSTNFIRYHTLRILHELFTSQTASNCSRGEILNIPYQWHWVNPNPRHKIYFTKNNKLLKDTKPPSEFSKYNSYADIDRTPYLFLSELVEESPKYYSSTCDSFSTFGWCSEREMAFVCLTELMGYNGKVVAEGNHSWSEFLIPMKTENGIKTFKVKVDNTFNIIKWEKINTNDIPKWKLYIGNSSQSKWYNDKAHSSIEKQKVQNHLVSAPAMKHIEKNVVNFLQKKI